MCKENINGILTPNLKLPFYVHHNKYKDKKANIATPTKPALPSSQLINILLRKELAAIPSLSLITINNNLINQY